MRDLIVIGGVGNGTVAMSSIEQSINPTDWHIKGWLNDNNPIGEILNGYPVLGKVQDASEFNDSNTFFVYTLLSPKKAWERYHLLESLRIPFYKFASFKHPMSVVGYGCQLGYGVLLEPFALLAPDVTIGNHTIVRSASVGHNSNIGCCSLVCIQAAIASYIESGRGVHFGIGCCVREHIKIGEWAVIAAGAVIVHDVPPYAIMAGNPAKQIGEAPHGD